MKERLPLLQEAASHQAVRTISFGIKLDQNNGIGPGFDHLRICLSLVILFWHSFGLSYGVEWTHGNAIAPYAPLIRLLHKGDYSYGIYIFGFPVQQTVTNIFPSHRDWAFNFLISLPITLSLAVLSWHYIEKPALSLRRRFIKNKANVEQLSVSKWQVRHIAIAILLGAYGLWVMRQADVFPFRELRTEISVLIRHGTN